MSESNYMHPRKLYFGIIALLTAIVYGQAIFFDFVGDDNIVLVYNTFIRDFSNLKLFLTEHYLTSAYELGAGGRAPQGSGEASFRPVVTFSYFLDYAFFGINAAASHTINVFIHTINSVLVYLLCQTILKHQRFALWSALIFALHPFQVESVVNIAFREDLLCMAFILTAWLFFLKEKKALSLIFFALALFSKETAAVFPCALILYSYYISGNKSFKRIIPYFLVLAVYLVFWLFIVPSVNKAPGLIFPTAISKTATMIKVFGLYGLWFINPALIHPTIIDASIIEPSIASPPVILALFFLLFIGFLIWHFYSKYKQISFGLSLSGLFLLPVANVIDIQNIFAVRYMYIPLLGVSICLAAIFKWAEDSGTNLKKYSKIIFFLTLSVYMLVGHSFSKVYSSGDQLFRSYALHYPNEPLIHKGLAGSYLEQRKYDLAMNHLMIAKELSPEDIEIEEDLGQLFMDKELYSLAVRQFDNVLASEPQRFNVAFSRCYAFDQMGNRKEAAQCLAELKKKFPRQSADKFIMEQ